MVVHSPLLTGKDSWPMSRKLFTIALMITVLPFAVYVTQGAVKVTYTLRKQHNTIQQLSTESEHLDKELDTKQEVKEQTKQVVQQYEQQAQDTVSERLKLEAELNEVGAP